MNLVHGLPQPINEYPTVMTIGVFDGVHRGHQHLIGSAVRRARELGAQSAVLTFDPHPDHVLHPDRKQRYLCSFERRAELIEQLGVDVLVVLPFTEATKSLSAQEFIAHICGALQLRELHVGHDFALGRKREGNVTRLAELGQEFGYGVYEVDALIVDGSPVSSSRIRAALSEGDVATAAMLLGHPFGVDGPVVRGDQRGRTIGFPTANIGVNELQMLPADGVYVCRAHVQGQRYGAVTNVGVRPTFDGVRRTVEAHLLDFNDDIYGETVKLEFLHRLRGEQKFNGIGELVAQITRDAEAARAWLDQE